MSGHAFLAPSSAGIWGKPGGCTAYPSMAAMFPEDEDRPEAREGTAAHEVGAALIQGFADTGSPAPWTEFNGKTATNGEPFDHDMYLGAMMYARDVAEAMRTAAVFAGSNLRVERRVAIPRVHAENNGTPDCVVHDKHNRVIHLWDFKYGRVVVEAYECWQLMDYAAGVLDEYGIDGPQDQHYDVVLHVVQPRAFHRLGPVRSWHVKACDLRGYFNQLRANADEAMSGGTARTGDHCLYCSARLNCDAYLKATVNVGEVCDVPQTVELTPLQASVLLMQTEDAYARIKSQREALQARIEAGIRQGRAHPGWTMRPGKGALGWTESAEQIIALGKMMGTPLAKPAAPITPTQALAAGAHPDFVGAYSKPKNAGMKLTRESEALAQQIFTREA